MCLNQTCQFKQEDDEVNRMEKNPEKAYSWHTRPDKKYVYLLLLLIIIII